MIRAALANDDGAREAIRTLSRHLASGCAVIVLLLDPELIILSGGLAQDNPFLPLDVECELAGRVTVWRERTLRVRTSELGYTGEYSELRPQLWNAPSFFHGRSRNNNFRIREFRASPRREICNGANGWQVWR